MIKRKQTCLWYVPSTISKLCNPTCFSILIAALTAPYAPAIGFERHQNIISAFLDTRAYRETEGKQFSHHTSEQGKVENPITARPSASLARRKPLLSCICTKITSVHRNAIFVPPLFSSEKAQKQQQQPHNTPTQRERERDIAHSAQWQSKGSLGVKTRTAEEECKVAGKRAYSRREKWPARSRQSLGPKYPADSPRSSSSAGFLRVVVVVARRRAGSRASLLLRKHLAKFAAVIRRRRRRPRSAEVERERPYAE